MRDDAWFAGFADGEGSFKIDAEYAPVFSINLRADDLACLEELHETFGGSLYIRPCVNADRPGTKPQAEWHVSGKAQLRELVAYFDRFPLRSKKARDFTIWRRAVLIYCRAGRRARELPELRRALIEGRGYERGGLVAVPPPDPQLNFGGLRAVGTSAGLKFKESSK